MSNDEWTVVSWILFTIVVLAVPVSMFVGGIWFLWHIFG